MATLSSFATPNNLAVVDATYEVKMTAKPSNYGVNHVSWEELNPSLNWLNLYLVRDTKGYPQSPSDGVVIYSTTTNDVIMRVTGINSADGSVASVNLCNPGISVTNTCSAGTIAYPVQMTAAPVNGLSNLLSKGQGVTVYSNTPNTGLSFTTSGTGFAVNNFLRVPASSFTGATATTKELEITNAYHIYDNGASLASTVNPGYNTVGANLNASKYYYSLFVSYWDTTTSANVSPSYISTFTPLYLKWKKIGEVSSDVVTTNRVVDAGGAVITKGTKDIILEHLPSFYTRNSDGSYNQDLTDFLSLFAFSLDSFIQKNNGIFYSADVENVDEILLTRLLNQLGAQYIGTVSMQQARTLLRDIVRAFKFNGSKLGISNYVEAYSGYAVNVVEPKNLLFDYNTSSFVESPGKWYPDPAVAGGYLGSGYQYQYTYGTGQKAAAGTAPLDIGNLSGGYFYTTNIDSYSNILNKYAYDTVLGTRYTNTISASSYSGNIITCNDTSKLFQGARLVTVSGPGKLAPGTFITKVLSPTTFSVSVTPLCDFSYIGGNTTFAIPDNVGSPMLKITPSTANATATFYSGGRRALTTSAYAAGVNKISYTKPFVAKVGDYISGHYSIPAGTYITAIATSTSGYPITLSNALTATLPSGTTLYLTSPTVKSYTTYVGHTGTTHVSVEEGATNASTEAAVDSYLVSPNTPYGFVIHFNTNNAATIATSVKLNWYDSTGTIISTSIASISGATASSPLTNYDYKNTWYPSFVCDVSPSNAAFVQPSFSVIASTTSYADAAMLIAPTTTINVAQKISGTVTIYTSTPHNFLLGSLVSVYTSDTTSGRFNTPFGSPATITAVSQDVKSGLYSFSYVLGSGTVTATAVTGSCVALPGIDVSVQPTYQVTAAAAGTPTTGSVRYTVSNPGNANLVGQSVIVQGITGATTGNFSGTFTVTAVTSTTITVTNSATGAASLGSGSVMVMPLAYNRLTLFEDARVTRLEIQPSRTNLCPNPNFEATIVGWNSTNVGLTGNATATTAANYVGNYSALVSIPANAAGGVGLYFGGLAASQPSILVKGSNASNKTINVNGTPVSISSNNYYAFSAYVKSDEASTFQVQVYWIDNAGNQLNGGIPSVGTATSVNASEWTRVSLSQSDNGDTAKAPTGACYAVMRIIKTSATGTSGDSMYVDAVLVEKSLTVEPYFDGNFDGYSWELTRDSMWENTINNSQSYLYPNRLSSQALIDTRVTDMVYYG